MEENTPKAYLGDINIAKKNYHELILKWISLMQPYKNPEVNLISSNSEILDFKYDNTQYVVTDNDVERTRNVETMNYPDYQKYLKLLLVYYCEKNQIKYKQGLNEMMGIFLLMKFIDNRIELYEVYNIYALFIDLFFCNYFYQQEIFSIKSSCSLIQLLLRYHEPEIYDRFNLAFVTSEVYATNWLLTVLSNKNSFDVCILLYDFIIYYNDKAMIYYIIIAFLVLNKELIFKKNVFQVIECVTKLGIDKIEIAKKMLEIAIEIKQNTPYSIYILIDILQIFKYKSHFVKLQYEKIRPNHFLVFPIFPSEVLYSSFPSVLSCPNYTCTNFNNAYTKNTWPRKKLCQCCKDKKLKQKTISYFLCDIRIFNNESDVYVCGVFPKMKSFPKSVLTGEDFENEFVNFMKDNSSDGPIHVIFVSNRTNNFGKYENKLYETKLTEVEKFSEKYGLSGKKEESLSDNLVKQYLKYNKDEVNLIKEYDNFRKIVKTLMKMGIKYISFSYGGFSEIHYLLNILKLPLTSHQTKECKFCKEDIIRIHKKKSMISQSTFNTLCSSDKNVILSCKYNQTRNATVVINETHIFLFTIIQDKNVIKFKLSHKMDKSNILAFETYEDNPSQISFLYSLNSCLSDLVKITLDFLSIPSINRFKHLCNTFNITN